MIYLVITSYNQFIRLNTIKNEKNQQTEEAERIAAQQKMVREAQSFLDQFRTNVEFDITKIYDRNAIRRRFITDRTEGKQNSK